MFNILQTVWMHCYYDVGVFSPKRRNSMFGILMRKDPVVIVSLHISPLERKRSAGTNLSVRPSVD